MTATSSQRDDIQGLRAIAVLAVMVFDLNRQWLPGGFIGVDIFFVISGFLMASIKLRQEQRGPFSVMDFYASRIRRIAPAAHELPLLHTWSLAVEMQFYAVLPLLLAVVNRRYGEVAVPYFKQWLKTLDHAQ